MARAPASRSARKTDPLATYRSKRDFTRTSEPEGTRSRGGNGYRFLVQRHWATRQHWDFRLEVDGVLKSWAVTRGPSANPADKRLAVRTEDHPVSYAGFEGTIPENEYGGGTVMMWDEGTFVPLNGDPGEAIDNGQIKFELSGHRMKGRWVLVRMHTQEKHENWLLIKERDDEVSDSSDLATRFNTSVTTGRSREQIESGKAAKTTKAAESQTNKAARTSRRRTASAATPATLPAFVAPMLCDTRDEAPDGDDWLHEVKHDGYRVIIAAADGASKVYTREGLDWTARYPLIATAAALLKHAVLIDAEAIVQNEQGLSDFAALVAAFERNSGKIVAMAFDLLHLDGKDLRSQPLEARKAALFKLIGKGRGAIHYSDHIVGHGPEVFKELAARGGEGIISKKINSTYRSGRSSAWLKIKTEQREDVLIIGWKDSTKGRRFSSLMAAAETPEGLVFAGGVGTGFSAQTEADLMQRFEANAASAPPDLIGADKMPRKVHFIDPPLRAEVKLAGWTDDRQMRHARFLGLREDRAPPKRTTKAPAKHAASVNAAPRKVSSAAAKKAEAARPAPVKITHGDRVVFPDDGITKQQVADYYAAVAERMVPHLRDRPVSLIRAPDGIGGEIFYQRHPLPGMARGIVPIKDPSGGRKTYFSLDGATGIQTAAQFGGIEIHGWGALADDLDSPDRMVFDLDPDEGLDFAAVKIAARDLKDHLAAIGLESYAMLTGGKGIHVVVPLDRSLGWGPVETFAAGFARGLAADKPDTYVATMSKARRKGRIFIDWLRNKQTATAVQPWSLRARKGAPVAVPVAWTELGRIQRASAFDIRAAAKRRDPWTDFFKIRQTIPPAALKLVASQGKP